jgi:hypothetical protein
MSSNNPWTEKLGFGEIKPLVKGFIKASYTFSIVFYNLIGLITTFGETKQEISTDERL